MKLLTIGWVIISVTTVILAIGILKFEDCRWIDVILVVASVILFVIGRETRQEEFHIFSAVCSIGIIIHQIYHAISFLNNI